MKIGYIKQTTKEQIEVQSELLISAGCMKIYIEPANNIQYKSKIKLDEAIESITTGDTIAVTRLSVLSHSVQNLLQVMNKLQQKSIVLEAIEQQYNSNQSYPMDVLLSYLSVFLADLKKEKQAIGIHKAKAKGKHLGRKSSMGVYSIQKAIELKKNHTTSQIANRFGISESTLFRHISHYRNGNKSVTKKAG